MTMQKTDLAAFELPWETLDAIIEGKSPIDLNSLHVRNHEEASALVLSYGYDLRLADDLAEMQALLRETVEFIENRFLTDQVNWQEYDEPVLSISKIPEPVRSMTDICELILTAATGKKPEKLWACAILKVLHTLLHLHNNPTLRYFQEASDSIILKFHHLLLPHPDGTFSLLGKHGRHIDLYGFETKYKKPRESILIKLLCKKENVAEEVWDLVGVRLITHIPADALLTIELLREQKVLLFSNIIPTRSRNTLVDFEAFRTDYERMLKEMQNGKRHFEDINALFKAIPIKPPTTNDFSSNPSSLPDYRSIHITCRHFLNVQPPEEPDELDLLDDPVGELDAHGTRIAFPFEIQILDKANYLENKAGKTAHNVYKLKQVIAARRRVLGRLLTQDTAQ